MLSDNLSEANDNQREDDNGISQAADATDTIEHLIEQLKLRTGELEEVNRELRRISHYRSLFLARMSHELRTPLTSILGFSEILLDHEQLSATQRRFCEKIQASAFQLQTSLNQLVDISRLEGGPTELFLQEFLLEEALRESCEALARAAEVRQVRLEYGLAPSITTVVSDRVKLRQILYNFLGWAVSRSSSEQEVKVYADTIDTMLRISIDDSGEPIPDLSRVLDPEVTEDKRDANINELVIIICRRLLDAMSGNVTLENRRNGGVRVVIQLPAHPAKE
ncbi:MAG TPA: HAMP domain-containing sensor histidine kinase [Pyrinomonadaceae bacterium]|nr:HAMP domain-containing sensor histidine kinase [Pyrinomonadaceae bacterium]